MTVTKLFRLGMTASFGGWGYSSLDSVARASRAMRFNSAGH